MQKLDCYTTTINACKKRFGLISLKLHGSYNMNIIYLFCDIRCSGGQTMGIDPHMTFLPMTSMLQEKPNSKLGGNVNFYAN